MARRARTAPSAPAMKAYFVASHGRNATHTPAAHQRDRRSLPPCARGHPAVTARATHSAPTISGYTDIELKMNGTLKTITSHAKVAAGPLAVSPRVNRHIAAAANAPIRMSASTTSR